MEYTKRPLQTSLLMQLSISEHVGGRRAGIMFSCADLRDSQMWVQILMLALASCVMSEQQLHLSEPCGQNGTLYLPFNLCVDEE